MRDEPECIYVREGYEAADICMEWITAFWSDGLTGNCLSVTVDRDDIHILLGYLNYVTGKLNKQDPLIDELIKRDFITD